MNIYEQLLRPVENKIYEGDTAISIAMDWSNNGNDRSRTDEDRAVLYGVLRKLQEQGADPITDNKYINTTSKLHESAIIILHGGIDAITFYVDKMGGVLNPSILCSDYLDEYEFDLLPMEDRKTYNKLLAEQNIAQSELIHTKEEECSP